MPKPKSEDPDNALRDAVREVLERLFTEWVTNRTDTSSDRPESAEAGVGPPDLQDARMKLTEEIEAQSDQGALNLDELIRLYHKEHDRPILALTEDIQSLISVYANVFEALKKESNVHDAARLLKERYQQLGLIPVSNQWPNPLGDRLMRHCLDKLHKYRRALLEILRSRGRELIRELNFDPTMAISFQISLGTDTSFAISVQPEVGISRNA